MKYVSTCFDAKAAANYSVLSRYDSAVSSFPLLPTGRVGKFNRDRRTSYHARWLASVVVVRARSPGHQTFGGLCGWNYGVTLFLLE